MAEARTFYIGNAEQAGLPAAYRPLAERPGPQPGAWASAVVVDAESGTLFHTAFDPRDRLCTLTPLPAEVQAILPADTPLERVWPALRLGHGPTTGIVEQYFRQGRYDLAHALARLVAEARDDTVHGARFRLAMVCIRALFRNDALRDAAPLTVGDPDAFAGLLLGDMWAWIGGNGWDLGATRDGIVRAALDAPNGPPADRVQGLDPGTRARLLEVAGLDDEHARLQAIEARKAGALALLDQGRSPRGKPPPWSLTGRPSLSTAAADLDWSSPLWHYLAFVPPALLTWILVAAAGNARHATPELSQLFILALGLPFYGAAASRAHGLWDTNVVWLYVSRLSVVVSYFSFAFLFILAGLLLPLALMPFLDLRDPIVAERAGLLYGVLLAFMAARFWPILVIPFMAEGTEVTAPIGYRWWQGPGLAHAWALTRGWEAFRTATLPVLAGGALGVGGVLALRGLAGGHWLAAPLLDLVLYFLALPAFFLLAWRRALPLVERAEWAD